MDLQHFGLRHSPLGKEAAELWDDGALGLLAERFAWLLHSPGVGLITGEPGVGKTAALRQLTRGLNPHRHLVIYQAETDFGRLDIYRGLARALAASWCRYGSSTRRRICRWSSSAICRPFSTSLLIHAM